MTETDHLDALARALTGAGWAVRTRYERSPALIHVLAPDVPHFGESVLITKGVGGVPWFISSMAVPLAPCHDPAGAVTVIAGILRPLANAARAGGENNAG